jgi:hypothetical protein
MLSEYERRELALIEQGLAEDDRRLVESFLPELMRPERTPWSRRRWMSRAVLGFGVALMVLGVLTSADGLFMQGVLFAGGGFLWLRWQGRAAKGTEQSPVRRRSPGRST